MYVYIIRRVVYTIPIIIGINFIVFILFFTIYNPNDMAKLHLGNKYVTLEQVEKWKEVRNLHYPYFYNNGFSIQQSYTATAKIGEAIFSLKQVGNYCLHIKGSDHIAHNSNRYLQLLEMMTWKDAITWSNIDVSSDPLSLPHDSFVKICFVTNQDNIKLPVKYNVEVPSNVQSISLLFQKDIPFAHRFSHTIFFQKSIKMLFFSFGRSNKGHPIGQEIIHRIPASLKLTIPIFILSLFINTLFAMLLAYFHNTRIDYFGVIFCIFLMSISSLIYIITGQFLFGKIWKLFPISGYSGSLFSIKFIILPIFIAIIQGAGADIRFYRTLFLEEINKDYVRMAQSKGLSERYVLFVHVLKNAAIPILTGVIVSIPLLIIGSLLLETFFSIPGLGSYLLEAIAQQDFSVVQAMVFLGSFLYIIGLLLTDICYTIIDPRIKLK